MPIFPHSFAQKTSGSKGICKLAAAMLPVALTFAGCNRGHSADVVATVNGHAIMRADMDRTVQAQLGDAQNPQTAADQSGEQGDSLRLGAVQLLINAEIVEQRAAKMNLTATPEEVDAKIAEIKAPYATDEQFAEWLKSTNQTLDILKREVRRALTINKLLNKEIRSKITVSDADVTGYFQQHKAEFDLIEPQYHLAVIRVTNVPSTQPANLQDSKAKTEAEAKNKIQALKNRLDSGEDFGVIAQQFSEDPSTAPSGGDAGFVPESQLRGDPAAGAAILKLKPAQMTDIFPIIDPQTKKSAGYAIYKLLEREPAGQRDISDPVVQQHIRQLLRDSRSQLVQNAYFEMLRDQAKVENFLAEEIFKNDAK